MLRHQWLSQEARPIVPFTSKYTRIRRIEIHLKPEVMSKLGEPRVMPHNEELAYISWTRPNMGLETR